MSQDASRTRPAPRDRMMVHLGTGGTLRRGGFWPRTGAYALDVVTGAILWVALFALLVVTTLDLGSTSPTSAAVAVLFGSFLAAVAVYGLLYGTRRTLGQALFGLRTVRTADGGRVGAWRGMWRMLGGALLVPGVPLLVVGMVLSAGAYTVIDKPERYAVISTR